MCRHLRSPAAFPTTTCRRTLPTTTLELLGSLPVSLPGVRSSCVRAVAGCHISIRRAAAEVWASYPSLRSEDLSLDAGIPRFQTTTPARHRSRQAHHVSGQRRTSCRPGPSASAGKTGYGVATTMCACILAVMSVAPCRLAIAASTWSIAASNPPPLASISLRIGVP